MKNNKLVKLSVIILLLFLIPQLHAQWNINLSLVYGDLRILADAANVELGSSVAHGDINGEGFQNMIIGAAGKFSTGDRGEVYVV